MCIIYPIQQLRCIQYICIQIFESAAAVTLHVVYRKHLFTNVFFNKYFCVLDSINDTECQNTKTSIIYHYLIFHQISADRTPLNNNIQYLYSALSLK